MRFRFGPTTIAKVKGKNVGVVTLAHKKESEILVLPNGQKLLSIGVGESNGMTRRKLMVVARQLISLARSNRVKRLAISFGDFKFPQFNSDEADLAECLAMNFEMANFEFVRYKTPPPEGWSLVDEVSVTGAVSSRARLGFLRGQAVAREVNNTRVLVNTPGGDMTPTQLAVAAKKASKDTSVKVKVLDGGAMKKLKMGGILGVARGSEEKPRFIILEYRGGSKNQKPIVLVGKGVTFDTGGLNLKADDHMLEMHMDMSGGAAVIHAVVLAAKLKLKKNVVGLVPAVENMPSGGSYRPGDILVTMSGKTIEVLNTDAEGRIILADALSYARKYVPRLVVDVATLTGAAMVALGQRAIAVFTKDEKLSELCRQWGEESGDYVWPLPLWEEYEEDIKGTFGDIANSGKSKYGGAITGAMFLYQFAKDYPWIHLDTAPRMTSIEGDYLAKGATGTPLRLLIKLIEQY